MFDTDDIINKAISISTPSGYKDLNRKIKEFAEQASDENFWLEKVFSSLAYRNFNDFRKLTKIIEKNKDDDLPVIAYYSRNLLEVVIWTKFCFQSDKNARIFYSDAGRDADDLLKRNLEYSIDKEGTTAARKKLKKNAAKQNICDIEKRFTNIRKAVKEVGLNKQFLLQNKLFSKFAHPTALQIISPRSGQEAQDYANSFYIQACVNYSESIRVLEERYGLGERDGLV